MGLLQHQHIVRSTRALGLPNPERAPSPSPKTCPSSPTEDKHSVNSGGAQHGAAFQLGKVSNLCPERLPAARASFSLPLSSPASPPPISAGPRPAPAQPPPASRAYLPLSQVLLRPQQVRGQEGLGRPEAGEEAVGAKQRGGQEPALAWDPSRAQEHGGRRRPPGHRAGHDHPRGGDTAPSFFSLLPTRVRLKRCPQRRHLQL